MLNCCQAFFKKLTKRMNVFERYFLLLCAVVPLTKVSWFHNEMCFYILQFPGLILSRS